MTMTARLRLALVILLLAGGCAPGYYDTPPKYRGETADYRAPGLYQSPESYSEYQLRIWQEESGR